MRMLITAPHSHYNAISLENRSLATYMVLPCSDQSPYTYFSISCPNLESTRIG